MSSDEPISDKSEDILNRNVVVGSVVRLISDSNTNCSVIAIDGKWGSGKTSFLNLVINELTDDVVILRYNPWLIGSDVDIINCFFKTLIDSLYPNRKLKKKFIRSLLSRIIIKTATESTGFFGPLIAETVETYREIYSS